MEELKKDKPNLDLKFQYALTLIKTRDTEKNREGMSLLQGTSRALLLQSEGHRLNSIDVIKTLGPPVFSMRGTEAASCCAD